MEDNEKLQAVRIIVLFGDLTGFTTFCEAITNETIEFDPFMNEYDRLIDDMESDKGYTIDDTGDGFMCTVELPPKDIDEYVVKVIHDIWTLSKKIESLIENKVTPSPAGFRVAGAAGYVTRKVKKNGRVVLRGKQINLAHNLLDIARVHSFICHSSLKTLISEKVAKEYKIEFTQLTIDTWILKIHL